MKTSKLRFLFPILLLLTTFVLHAQSSRWTISDDEHALNSSINERQIIPSEYSVFHTDFESLTNSLELLGKQEKFAFQLPLPDGSTENFICNLNGLFPKKLADKYPGILSFSGKSTRNSNRVVRMGISPKGFHAMILIPGSSSVFIDVYAPGNTTFYISYYSKNYIDKEDFICGVENGKDVVNDTIDDKAITGDCQLRSYRFALACSGEYATFHGGTKESVMAAFAVALNRINGIYERDLGITLTFIDNTDDLIFLNANTDPYSLNSFSMLNENQSTIDSIIGQSNYDIGHVFGTSGGYAGITVVCNYNGKAKGVSGAPNPINNNRFLYVTTHEIGHQFGATHTQNNPCFRNNNSSVEVGSGNTIMSYAGGCSPNSKLDFDFHFHANSINSISNFIKNGQGSNCPEIIETTNTSPDIAVEFASFNLPINTPFMLEASATDADGDMLTYSWEQNDKEIATMPPLSTNTSGPAFICNAPLFESKRFFPNLDTIINNGFFQWEVLPSVNREMNFRCIVRDNNSAVGCTEDMDVQLYFSDSAGPFLVLEPYSAITWNATEMETVTWDVAGTNVNPINCQNVDILLSTDGGYTYEIILAEGIPNDGSVDIEVPILYTTTARVMVKCSDNVFFDISDEDFSIITPFNVSLEQEEFIVCQGDFFWTPIKTEAFGGFDEEITFSIVDSPPELDISFFLNPIPVSTPTVLEIDSIQAPTGKYEINIVATTNALVIDKLLIINVQGDEVDELILESPLNGEKQIAQSVLFEWNSLPGVTNYSLLLSTSPLFIDTIVYEIVPDTSLLIDFIDDNSIYYWRTQAEYLCAENPFSETFAFQLANGTNCSLYEPLDIPMDISTIAIDTIVNTLLVTDVGDFDFIQCKIQIDHTWVGDLTLQLTSPSGVHYRLMDRVGVPNSEFGCNSDDLELIFIDLSPNSAADLDETCDDFEPTYQPIDLFSDLIGDEVNGTWTLQIVDHVAVDGGVLLDWNIQFCSQIDLQDPELTQNIFIVQNTESGIVTPEKLSVNTNDPMQVIYTVLDSTKHGELRLYDDNQSDYHVLYLGMTFTQSDIDANRLVYQHGLNSETEDDFLFSVLKENSNWTHNKRFEILISQSEVIGFVSIEQEIACNNAMNGAVRVDISGRIGPYSYSINGVDFQNDSIFSELDAGEYMIVVKDVSGSVIYEDTVQLMQPEPIIATVNQDFYTTVIMASGGIGNISYSLDNIDYQDDPTFSDLANGVYTIYIKDENECIIEILWTIDITPLSVEVELINPLCAGDSLGIIIVNPTGGFPDYSFSIGGTTYQSSNEFTNLPAGDYEVYTQDAGDAIYSGIFSLTEPPPIEVTAEYIGGNIVIDAFGGSGIYSYSIDGGVNFQNSNVFLVDIDGTYEIVVMDNNGCVDISQLTLSLVDSKQLELYDAINIHPVPFHTTWILEINVDTWSIADVKIEVYNILGQKQVFDYVRTGGQFTIDGSLWAAGHYSVLIQIGNTRVIKKVIKI